MKYTAKIQRLLRVSSRKLIGVGYNHDTNNVVGVYEGEIDHGGSYIGPYDTISYVAHQDGILPSAKELSKQLEWALE